MAIRAKQVMFKLTPLLLTTLLTAPLSANAGIFDNLSEITDTISSIGETAKSLQQAKSDVDGLTQSVGYNGAANTTATTASIAEGSVLSGKLKQTHVYTLADSGSSKAYTLGPNDIMIFMGAENNGYYSVQSDKGAGWVSKPLVNVQ